MSTPVTFAYGSIYGPVVETTKTDMETLAYGSPYGPVVGVESGASPITVDLDLLEIESELFDQAITNPASIDLGLLELEIELLDQAITNPASIALGLLEPEAELLDQIITNPASLALGLLELEAELLDQVITNPASLAIGLLELEAELLELSCYVLVRQGHPPPRGEIIARYRVGDTSDIVIRRSTDRSAKNRKVVD